MGASLAGAGDEEKFRALAEALAQKEAELKSAAVTLAQKEAALQGASGELAGKSCEIQAKSQALASKDAELQQASSELSGAQKIVEDLESRLADVSEKLRSSEAEAAKQAEQLEAQTRVLAQRAVQLESDTKEKEQQEVRLQGALGEADRLHKLVKHLDGNVADPCAKLPAGVLDAARHKFVSPLEFYDAVLAISKLEDIFVPGKGWKVQVTHRRPFDFGASLEGVRVIPIGQFNSGKTWLIAQLSGAELPTGASVHTEGISMKEATADNLKIVLLDTVGSNSPVEALPDVEALPGGVHSRSTSSGVETVLQELRVQEDFYRQVCFELGQVVLFLVGQISHKDQLDLVRLARAIRKDRVRKDIIVVHNLREWDMASLQQKKPKDKMSYVERNQALFGLDDGSLDVTIGAETRRIIRHQGLFKGEGEGDSRDYPVNVHHYYLTNHSLPCSCNKFAIQDMKATITRSDRRKKSLAEEFAAAATKVQGRFASFNVAEPQIVWDQATSCFRTKDSVPDGAYRMKPRDLGSYFTMGSDDPDYNIMLVPGSVKVATGRGAKTVEVQEREAYLLQIELPGLKEGSLADIREQIQRKDSGALRKEQVEGERSMQWTISFQATLMNTPDGLYADVADMTKGDVDLSRVASLHVVSDLGSRSHFRDGARTVKVSLRTGIMDYDTSEEPIVSYLDGVLGITLMRQARR